MTGPGKGVWYVLDIDWALNGDLSVNMSEEGTGTLVANVGPLATGYTTPGGFMLRGFTTNAAAFIDVDDLTGPTGGGFGTSYCGPAVTNTSGGSATIQAMGDPMASANNVTLVAADMPANQFGFFMASMTQGLVPNPGGSNGNLCLGGTIGRYVGAGQIQNSGAMGTFSLALDLTQTPAGPVFVSIVAGDVWNFQAWFRDIGPMGQPESNFTQGLEVTFL